MKLHDLIKPVVHLANHGIASYHPSDDDYKNGCMAVETLNQYLSLHPNISLHSNDVIKQLDKVIDLVCLEAADIHNLGNYVSDSKAQQIINSIRSNLDDFKQQLINSQQGQGETS